MKAGWEIKPISEIAKTSAGGTPKKTTRAFYDGGSIPWLLSGEVGKRSITEAKNFITEAGLKGSSAKLFPPRSVLVAMYGATAGEVGVLEFEASTNQAVCAILPGPLHEPDFVYYYLLHAKPQLVSQAVGNAQPNISQAKIKSLPIPHPPLAEQKRIVAILDEAFAGLDRAKANAEANLASAKGLYLSALREVFANGSQEWSNSEPPDQLAERARANARTSREATKTGGREATLRPIPGSFSLSVLDPGLTPRPGWKWTPLSMLARMESGHTPSRRKPEYWGGDVPWIGIKDARNSHGRVIEHTMEHTNELGVANSSTRILPAGAVCLSRTASVGYVTVMGRPMATSQDFVNWVCSDALEPEFLMLLLLAQGDDILRFASGSVHQTIYFPEAKAFYICHPPVSVQREICTTLREIEGRVSALVEAKTEAASELDKLRQSLLAKAFAGELT